MNKDNISWDAKTSRRGVLSGIGLGALGIAALGARSASAQIAIDSDLTSSPFPVPVLTATDLAILNFALNLEYLEANFYSYATTGFSLKDQGVDITGHGTLGTVNLPVGATPGTPLVTFNDPNVEAYALEITKDEIEHVKFLRGIILNAGQQPIAQPAIDLVASFTAAGNAAGVAGFSPFGSSAGDLNFLLGGLLFEDVGVTAYHGALASFPSLKSRVAASAIMGTEAYHASIIRTQLYDLGATAQADALAIANAVNMLGGAGIAQGLVKTGTAVTTANIVPADSNALVFTRTTQQVLNIVYLAVGATKGGFFPNGVNT